MTVTLDVSDGIATVTMAHPPVNALTVADTWAIRDAFAELGRRDDLRAAILTAEGRGFNAGIDIKEMQSVEGWDHLLGSGEACYATFHRIYNSRVPVIAAVLPSAPTFRGASGSSFRYFSTSPVGHSAGFSDGSGTGAAWWR